jgi:hypothetical protein
VELEGDPTVQSGCRLSATADPQTGAPARGAGRMRTAIGGFCELQGVNIGWLLEGVGPVFKSGG